MTGAAKSSYPLEKEKIENIDVFIGQKIRSRRKLLGISQSSMADHLGISFQQIQKYENGKNRVSAGRLLEISHFLEVPLAYFYYNNDDNSESPSEINIETDILNAKETKRLLDFYYSIKDQQIRESLLAFMKSLNS